MVEMDRTSTGLNLEGLGKVRVVSESKTWGNPFYLGSVLALFAALHMISSQENESLSLAMLLGFYSVQVIYEVVIFSMALRLIKGKINLEHGKFLLFVVLLLSCDVTFYQSRISTYCFYDGVNWISFLITGLNLVLNSLELSLLVESFELNPKFEKIFCCIATLLLISGALPLFTQMIDSGMVSAYLGASLGWWEVYLPWFLAFLCPIPVIYKSWTSKGRGEYSRNQFLGNELVFYAPILLIPTLFLPLHLILDVHSESALIPTAPESLIYCMIPFALSCAFLLQTFLKVFLEELCSINAYDFACCLGLFLLAFTFDDSANYFGTEFHPYLINKALILAMFLVTALTRKNLYSICFLAAASAYGLREVPIHIYRTMTGVWSSLGITAKAILLSLLSFGLLGVGYYRSNFSQKRFADFW
jgi:hypothetical protein